MDWEKYQSNRQWAGDLKPSMKRRRVGHDYQGRCIYMITLVVKGRQPLRHGEPELTQTRKKVYKN